MALDTTGDTYRSKVGVVGWWRCRMGAREQARFYVFLALITPSGVTYELMERITRHISSA